jgi:hypothetical protein
MNCRTDYYNVTSLGILTKEPRSEVFLGARRRGSLPASVKNLTLWGATNGTGNDADNLSRSAPESVLYEPTATEPAKRTLRLAFINTADDQSVEIRRIPVRDFYTEPLFGPHLQISIITPPLPATIPPRGRQLIRVDTLVPAGAPPREAFRPYFPVSGSDARIECWGCLLIHTWTRRKNQPPAG